jgi:hypothetical protein
VSREELKQLGNNLNENNFIEYAKVVRDLYAENDDLREWGKNMHRLQQNVSVINRTHSKKLSVLQFLISDPEADVSVEFWLELDPNEDLFKVHEGVNPSPFVIFKINDLPLATQYFQAYLEPIQNVLDANDPKISIEIVGQSSFSTKKICIKLFLNFAGLLRDCFGYYCPAVRD